jgi:WD40 repeat protein
VWDAPSGAKRLRFLGHRDSINVCAFTADGQFIVSGSSDGLLKVWALQRVRDAWESPQVGARRPTLQDWHQMLRPYVLKGHRREVNTCAVAPDGSFVVSGSSDRTLKIWNIAEILRSDVFEHSSSRTLGGHDRDVTGCAVSPSALWIASVSEDKSIKIWSVSTGDCVTTLNVDSPLSACAWLPDGERLVATGAAGVYLLQFVHGN